MSEQRFTLTSEAFEPAAAIPTPFTCDGDNLLPPLTWIHPPKGARSFALIVDDPDAPRGTFTHCVLFNIPAQTRGLAQGEAAVGTFGRNDFQQTAYGGPCPPPNHGEHRYYFRLHALDVAALDLPAGAARADVEKAMTEHVIASAELMGRYRRGGA